MDRIDKILRYFDPQRFIEVCEARFDTLRTQVVANLQTKTGSSGKRVNSLGVPEWATGATAASLQTQVEQNDDGFEVTFCGRCTGAIRLLRCLSPCDRTMGAGQRGALRHRGDRRLRRGGERMEQGHGALPRGRRYGDSVRPVAAGRGRHRPATLRAARPQRVYDVE